MLTLASGSLDGDVDFQHNLKGCAMQLIFFMSLTVSDPYINKNLSASLLVFDSNSIKSTSPDQREPATLDYKQIVVIVEQAYRELPYHHLVILRHRF